MFASLLVWAAYFAFVYLFNALVCARNLDHLQLLGFGIVPLTIAVVTVMAAAFVLALLINAVRSRNDGNEHRNSSSSFLRYLTVAAALFSILAIGWGGLPALLVPPCG